MNMRELSSERSLAFEWGGGLDREGNTTTKGQGSILSGGRQRDERDEMLFVTIL